MSVEMTFLATLAIAFLLSAALLVLSGLHIYWGIGGVWPGHDVTSLARKVVRTPNIVRMPGAIPCMIVAAVLAVTALWPLVMIGLLPPIFSITLIYVYGLIVAAVFLLRGVAAYTQAFRRRFPEEPFASRDRWLYAPLCLLIGAGFIFMLM